jgi:glycosyltransferase involved in cell wall biosynthesis
VARKLNTPLVSVVVPTLNSGRFLESCLRSVRAQTYGSMEVIVVDNYSEDQTVEIAKAWGARVLLKGPERSAQRNCGAKHASGEYLFFIDSDMELTPNVVKECINEVLERKANVIIVPEVSVGEGFWTRCKALERSCYVGDETIEAARFFKKDIFFQVGGYDEEITGEEDWDLHQRVTMAAHRIGRINAFIQHHEGKLTLRESMVKKYNYGRTLKRYKMKHPKEARIQFRLIRPAFVANWRKLAKDPAHASGMLLMKVCEYGAAWFGSFATEANDL